MACITNCPSCGDYSTNYKLCSKCRDKETIVLKIENKSLEERVKDLENKIEKLERDNDARGTSGMVIG